ncbi:AraC family transcriptional regulator [Clostridium cibarium]|uniref:AraC family transcriptional regulator n=1 Tax=Clostridium cibarium TaxID=2762247 RepID=A0ABR8PT00_9CLOT|nr:AraC family transcriptional regulator [Clostridium cibarium]MBD7911284.1 AraC family transcriptional regulator [Clostridium cibarium]
MEWLDKMNAALDYIEENLDGKIDNEIIAQKACCSNYNFQRMFSFIADVTLAEYIRRRRLTQAAFDLQKTDSTILDIALKYGYDSPVSFARAFQNLHGLNPSEAKKKGSLLKTFPKISFKLTIKGVEEMKYRIEQLKGFRLVGVSKPITTVDGENFKLIPKMWAEICENKTDEKIMKLGKHENPEFYGVCYNCRKDDFDYMIAVESDSKLPKGLVELVIPELTWVKFECRGKLPEAQQSIWKRVFTEWFPSSGYEHADGPELEWYSNEDMDSDNYLSEVWIPIKKSN